MTIIESPILEDLKDEIYLLNLLKYIMWTEPGTGFLSDLLSMDNLPEDTPVDRGLNMMINAVKKNRERLDDYAEDLAIEFARLFIGPKSPPAIPYSSFYLSESKTVMANVTLEVRKRYLEAGMAVKELYSIPDDHIGIELEFIYYLTDRIIELFENAQREEASRLFEIRGEFIDEHMKLWVPVFVDRILDSTQEDFYRGAAYILRGVIGSKV